MVLIAITRYRKNYYVFLASSAARFYVLKTAFSNSFFVNRLTVSNLYQILKGKKEEQKFIIFLIRILLTTILTTIIIYLGSAQETSLVDSCVVLL